MSTTATTNNPPPPAASSRAGDVVAAPLLDYRHAPPVSVPTEFDRDLDAERVRWIRKRFLWFCAINILIQLAFFIGFASDMHVAPPLAKFFNVLDLIVVVGGYAAAFVFVVRRRQSMTLAGLLKLGLAITALLPSLSILFTRLDISLNAASWHTMIPDVPPGTAWAVMSPWSILMWFTIACLFIPWTARECLRPAAVILVANALLVMGDVAFTIDKPMPRAIALFHLVVSPLSFLPGLLICWWRFSRFRKRFQLTFESTSYRRLQTELAGARRIHESTLPPPKLHASGPVRLAYVYEPMRQIGGDILYVHPPDQSAATRLSVVLIDVNGHGFGAALMANRVIGEVQRLFAENPDAAPHEILAALNRYVRLTLARDSVFATALCLRVDATAGTLEYANGGHPPAFLRRAADGSVTRLDPDTYLLGVHDGDDYCADCVRLAFAPGDALLAYTDGATEARDPAGQMLTIGGLTHLFTQLNSPPDRWPAMLLNQVLTHRRAPAQDDTLLVSVYRA
jgi:serine phosphatase RsbU (regulator of sigma subunit)